MAEDPQARADQLAIVGRQFGDMYAIAANSAGPDVDALHPVLRLPLVELALPALRQRTPAERTQIINLVFALINADGQITAYEYCLSRLIYSSLTEANTPRSGWRGGRSRLRDNPSAVATLFAILAQSGNDDPAAAAHAFNAGLARALPGTRLPYAPPAQGVTALEAAWPPLLTLAPEDAQLLVAGVVAVISDDGVTTVTELELLRTICALLHAPLPL